MDWDLLCCCRISRSFIDKPLVAKTLLSSYTSPSDIFNLKERELVSLLPKYGKEIAEMFSPQGADKAARELEWCQKFGITPIPIYDCRYPSKLRECVDAPLLLFKKGSIPLEGQRVVSIVGSRKATEYGRRVCDMIVERLASTTIKPVIVSGLAYGIDTFAHQAALRNGLKTIAVMGTGMTRLYPSGNRALAGRIIKEGALITELFSDSSFYPAHFVARNRIIAGLSDAVIVCESAIKGGGLITASLGFDYGREVFAVPGRIGDVYSEGCNNLIKRDMAHILSSMDDFFEVLNWKVNKRNVEQEILFPSIDSNKSAIINVLRKENELNPHEIADLTGLSAESVSINLIELEMENIITSSPSGRYSLRL